jgi:RNA polymerase subunit RPABC4/transcription elongation factor Spt4
MSRICPQCGNLNNDDQKFCTTCGNSFVSQSDQSGSSIIPQKSPVAAGSTPDPNRLLKILVGAGIAVIVIITIFLIMTHPGMAGILQSSIIPTTQTMATPLVTSYVIIETPAPGQTTIPTDNLSPITTIPETPHTSPTVTKDVVCPSDRRACGANCTDTMTDHNNCGGCNVSCTIAEICRQGLCVIRCSDSETSCPDGCRDLLYDAQNCGACGNSCPVGLACNNSVCAPTLVTTIPTYAG